LLGKYGAAKLLLGHNVLRHLGVDQRFPAAARWHLDVHHGVIGTDGQLPLQSLFEVRAAIEDHRGGYRVGCDLSPSPSYQDAVGARKRLGCHIPLPVRGVRGIGGRIRIGQQSAARSRPRRGEGADRAGRFLHDHVDVGVTVPRQLQFDIANERPIDSGPEVGGLVRVACFFERIDGGFRQPRGPREDLPLIGRPLVGQHARARPTERREVFGTGGERHGEGVGLSVCRVEVRHLPAETDRAAGRPESREVIGQSEQVAR
jgi:hypothetical protein